jgi:Mg2+ and Co2+ transporter CorA
MDIEKAINLVSIVIQYNIESSSYCSMTDLTEISNRIFPKLSTHEHKIKSCEEAVNFLHAVKDDLHNSLKECEKNVIESLQLIKSLEQIDSCFIYNNLLYGQVKLNYGQCTFYCLRGFIEGQVKFSYNGNEYSSHANQEKCFEIIDDEIRGEFTATICDNTSILFTLNVPSVHIPEIGYQCLKK